MKVWVYSDLHLLSSEDPLYQPFLQSLNEANSSQDHVVLAGDIFELFVGDSAYFYSKFALFFKTLKVLSDRGVKLYYIEGNHDFHLKKNFEDIPIRFEEERVVLKTQDREGNEKKIWIAHGDLVDQNDEQYLRLRSFFRSRLVKTLVEVVPGFIIKKVSEKIARLPEQKEIDLPEHWPADRRDHLRKTFRDYAESKKRQGFDYVILGHCHDLDETKPFYWNMGYPPVHRQFLFYESRQDLVERRNFPGISAKN